VRLLASTTAGTGHFEPMLPVLRACADAGHEVLVACLDSFVDQVDRAGLACAPFDDAPGDKMAAVFSRLPGMSYDDGNRVVIGDVFATLDTDAALPRLSATVARWRPHVIVRDPSEYASWLLAERDGVPLVRVAIGLLSSDPHVARIAAQALATAAERNGLSPHPDENRLNHGPVIAAGPAVFDPPDGLDPRTVHRYAPAPTSAKQASDKHPMGDEPLVYVTFGTVAAAIGLWPKAYRSITDALADLPVRVLLTTGLGVDTSEIGPLPPRMAVTEFLAQETVLAHASVMVTHGGYGSVLGGLRAGVPMVVTPMFADQRDNAARVASVGAGVHVQPSPEPMEVSPALGPAVSAGETRLLGDGDVRVAAQQLARDMAAQPPVDSVVSVITGTVES